MTLEMKTRDEHGNYVWVPAAVIKCANPDCKNERIEYTVPADGFPVTCGACGKEIK